MSQGHHHVAVAEFGQPGVGVVSECWDIVDHDRFLCGPEIDGSRADTDQERKGQQFRGFRLAFIARVNVDILSQQLPKPFIDNVTDDGMEPQVLQFLLLHRHRRIRRRWSWLVTCRFRLGLPAALGLAFLIFLGRGHQCGHRLWLVVELLLQ